MSELLLPNNLVVRRWSTHYLDHGKDKFGILEPYWELDDATSQENKKTFLPLDKVGFIEMASDADETGGFFGIYDTDTPDEHGRSSTLAGYISATRWKCEVEDIPYQLATVDAVAIHPNYRGQRLGSMLMRCAEIIAASPQSNMRQLGLHLVVSPDGALPFYEKLGYKKFRKQLVPYHYTDDHISEIQKRVWLFKPRNQLPENIEEQLWGLFKSEKAVIAELELLAQNKTQKRRQPDWIPRDRYRYTKMGRLAASRCEKYVACAKEYTENRLVYPPVGSEDETKLQLFKQQPVKFGGACIRHFIARNSIPEPSEYCLGCPRPFPMPEE